MHTSLKSQECEHLKLEVLSTDVSKEPENLFKDGFRVLPLVGNKRNYQSDLDRHSMVHNKKLSSNWAEYQKRVAILKSNEPKNFNSYFPANSDFHFLNCKIVYDPSLTIANRKSYRYSMRAGPGFDNFDQLPIPNNVSLRPKPPKSAKRRQKNAILKNIAKKYFF